MSGMKDRYCHHLRDELDRTLFRFIKEYRISYEELLGVLDIIKHDHLHELRDNMEEK